MNTLIITKNNVKARAVIAALAVVSAVALPQIFHAIGALSAVGGAAVGAMFLPMHIPVLMAGLLGGTAVGLAAGVVSPLVSFALSGMPAAAMLPFMVIELAGYGLASGLLARTKLPLVIKVLAAQAAGRALRAVSVVTAVYALNVTTVQLSSIWTTVTAGLFGIILQLVLIPLLIPRIRELAK